jgi:NADP-dependent aldehyde dehydrogenase
MSNFENISYIATEPCRSGSGFSAVNPSSGEKLPGTFANNTVEDVDRAVKAAQEAFTSYSRTSDKERAEFLEEIAIQIEARQSEIVARGSLETALPEMRLNGETGRTCGQLRMFAQILKEGSWVRAVIDTADAERQPLPKPDVRLTTVAVGPVAVFGASNFPLAFSTAGGDTASALAAGCPVINKAHSAHPGTAILVAEAINAAIKKCGVHPGVFSIISSDISRIGGDLVVHPGIKAAGFTGSVGGGRALFDLAKGRPEPIPFFGELGSTNPVFLMPNKLANQAEEIAEGFVTSLNMGCGQFCTNPGLLVAVSGDDLDKFKESVVTKLANVPSQTMLTRSIAEAYETGANKMKLAQGVDVVGQGPTGDFNQAQSMLLSVPAKDWLDNLALEHEVFGPFSMLVECDSIGQMLEVVDRMYGHLTGTVMSDDADSEDTSAIVAGLRDKVGRIIRNGWPTGVEVCQAMQHGGPYPAATFSPTSVGGRAIDRWVRPVAYQNMTDNMLPDELKSNNPLNILRLVNGEYTRSPL